MYLQSFLISAMAFLDIIRGNSIASIPFKMILYVFIGSGPVNGGLKEKNNILLKQKKKKRKEKKRKRKTFNRFKYSHYLRFFFSNKIIIENLKRDIA